MVEVLNSNMPWYVDATCMVCTCNLQSYDEISCLFTSRSHDRDSPKTRTETASCLTRQLQDDASCSASYARVELKYMLGVTRIDIATTCVHKHTRTCCCRSAATRKRFLVCIAHCTIYHSVLYSRVHMYALSVSLQSTYFVRIIGVLSE